MSCVTIKTVFFFEKKLYLLQKEIQEYYKQSHNDLRSHSISNQTKPVNRSMDHDPQQKAEAMKQIK